MTKYTLINLQQNEITNKVGSVKVIKKIDNNKYLTATENVIMVTDKDLQVGTVVTGKLVGEVAPFAKVYNMVLCGK